jgi:hypothetical protein
VQLDDQADRFEDLARLGHAGRRGVPARAQNRGREPHDGGDVGHRAHDRNLRADDRLDARRRKAGGDRHDELCAGNRRPDLAEHAFQDLRLDGEDHDVGRPCGLEVRVLHPDAELPGEGRGFRGLRMGGRQTPAASPARRQDPAQKGRAHVSGAENGDPFLVHSGRIAP